MRGNNLKVGDKIVAVYDRTASRRQPAGYRSGDTLLQTGAFVEISPITVEAIGSHAEGIQVRFRDDWYGPWNESDVLEVIREGEAL